MNNLNIVNLIESNPITKLSNTYNNKLLNKIKETFTDTQQQLFVTSFYCYLNYNQTNDYVIDLDNIWQWLGFSQKARAKELLEKHFMIEIDYKISLCNLQEQVKHGGNNKETIMLTIKTFKLFCMKASTKKAHEIHEYFIKLEEILHTTINEESNELKLQLEQIKLEHNNNLVVNNALEKEKMLLREFYSAGALIYIIKVKSYENGEYVVKIGESRIGIQARYNEHKANYGDILLLDCFMCKRSKQFEDFIHDKIKFNRVNNLEGHENARELFLIGKNLSYRTLNDIITNNIKQYNEVDFDRIFQELETIKNNMTTLPIQSTNNSNNEFETILKLLLDKIDNLEKSNKDILEKLVSLQIKTTTGFNEPLSTVGPRLQCINPETLQLVKVYETVAECLKNNPLYKRPSIDKAVRENTIYHGFRWLYVDREIDQNVIHTIIPTKDTRIQHLGYIAKLNKEKTEILNVYLDRKSASIANNYPTDSSLDIIVKKCMLSKNNYYYLYDECSTELKNDFIKKNNGEPILYKDGIGQYDSNNKLIKEFVCKNYCWKSVGISDRTLRTALDKKIMYNGFYYKYLGSKLYCF